MATDGIKLFSDDQVTKVDTQLDTNQLYDLDLARCRSIPLVLRSRADRPLGAGGGAQASGPAAAGRPPQTRVPPFVRTGSRVRRHEVLHSGRHELPELLRGRRGRPARELRLARPLRRGVLEFDHAADPRPLRLRPLPDLRGGVSAEGAGVRGEKRAGGIGDLPRLRLGFRSLCRRAEINPCGRAARRLLTRLLRCRREKENRLNESSEIKLGRRVPSALSQTSDRTRRLFFVGTEGSPLLSIWCMTFTSLSEFAHFAPETHSLTTGNCGDANVVGLVVGTLDIAGYREAIQRVRALCKAANKKLYVFSIGKLNEAKLSNFAGDIDVFVLLSCPFGIVLDSSDFYKPLVSMFEAEIALNTGREWFAGDGWTAEFAAFLSDSITAADEEKADVSLITGRVRGIQVVEGEADGAEGANRQIVEYSAGDYFANRSWKGLDDEHHEEDEDDKTLKEGLKGVGIGYTSESRS
ncbi:Diphthamide biosynthesis protein 2 [Aphelenchoides fujianensis]|nr:Diphthamide biosynthesis protein 2 [Aphelenchoides fujianensis]